MSEVLPTVSGMTINPWRRLRALADFELVWHVGGPMGETDFEEKTISIRRGLSWEERRCTVMHETIHVERGPVVGGHYDQEELRVRKETAVQMLPRIKDIADAYAWAQGDDEGAALELGVDVDVLRTRMKYMSHPAERAYLARRFADQEE